MTHFFFFYKVRLLVRYKNLNRPGSLCNSRGEEGNAADITGWKKGENGAATTTAKFMNDLKLSLLFTAIMIFSSNSCDLLRVRKTPICATSNTFACNFPWPVLSPNTGLDNTGPSRRGEPGCLKRAASRQNVSEWTACPLFTVLMNSLVKAVSQTQKVYGTTAAY